MRWRPLAVGAVALVAFTACGPGEIDDIFAEIPSRDLSSSDDAGERAAGDSVIEVLTAREAEDNLERGLTEGDTDAIQQAADLRPDDPRYPMHQIVLLEAQGFGGTSEWQRAFGELAEDVVALHPDDSPAERRRILAELYMETLSEAIGVNPDAGAQATMTEKYCEMLTETYPTQHTETNPGAVAIYLATADYSLCN